MGAVTLRLSYEDGTVRVDADSVGALPDLPGVEREDRVDGATARAPAHRYAQLVAVLDRRGVPYEDAVLAAESLDLSTTYELRPYQREALDAWRAAGDRGVVEFPTGSGKTVIAVVAAAELGTATLVVAPTVDLVSQWRRELAAEFGRRVGQLGGGEQRLEPVTVATYDSAYISGRAR